MHLSCTEKKEKKCKEEVREHFLGFLEAESTKGVALTENFMNTLTEFGIDIHKMRTQRCDNAANMSGVHRRVQTVTRQQVPEAVYCHCKAYP